MFLASVVCAKCVSCRRVCDQLTAVSGLQNGERANDLISRHFYAAVLTSSVAQYVEL